MEAIPSPEDQLRRAALPDGRIDVKSLDLAGVRALIAGMGKERYRALQVYKWLWQRGVGDFAEMTNISKAARAELAGRAAITWLERVKVERSADGTRKYLWRLADGHHVESVLIPDDRSGFARADDYDPDKVNPPRLTLCVSSQVGCAMGCTFCLTGDLGLRRHLTPAEIANQVLQVSLELQREGVDARPGTPDLRRITNIVMMGMGEPLHNLDNLTVALRNLLHEDGMGFSHRRITVSTVGLVPAMVELNRRVPVNLAISLNATTEEQRRAVMPITRRYGLDELMRAAREMELPPGKRITFEYVMMGGFNDGLDDARRLIRLLQGIKAKVNLIPYNENPHRDIRRPAPERVRAFQDHLVRRGVSCSVRTTRGDDISAACGQLGKAADGAACDTLGRPPEAGGPTG